jgi:truncated hemoglobin YjbI
MTSPVVGAIKRRNGVAGQYALTATVTYPGEGPEQVTFYGSAYGGPIVMQTPSGHQVFVSNRVCDRIGATLSPEWVRAFFGMAGASA